MTRYSKAEEAWLREHYHAGTINDTLDAFEREFGMRPTKQALFVKCNKMGLRKDRHYDERYVPAQARIRWSEPAFAEMREWMLANDSGESVFGTIEAFEAEFGVRLNRAQVSRFRSTHGTSRRASHGSGKPSKPVGSERMGKDGYVMVKVREWPTVPQSKDNWRFKHHVAWEEANGEPLPEGVDGLLRRPRQAQLRPGQPRGASAQVHRAAEQPGPARLQRPRDAAGVRGALRPAQRRDGRGGGAHQDVRGVRAGVRARGGAAGPPESRADVPGVREGGQARQGRPGRQAADRLRGVRRRVRAGAAQPAPLPGVQGREAPLRRSAAPGVLRAQRPPVRAPRDEGSREEGDFMSSEYCRLRRNGNISLVHTRQDFDAVIEAHNNLVDYCESLEERIAELERAEKEAKA